MESQVPDILLVPEIDDFEDTIAVREATFYADTRGCPRATVLLEHLLGDVAEAAVLIRYSKEDGVVDIHGNLRFSAKSLLKHQNKGCELLGNIALNAYRVMRGLSKAHRSRLADRRVDLDLLSSCFETEEDWKERVGDVSSRLVHNAVFACCAHLRDQAIPHHQIPNLDADMLWLGLLRSTDEVQKSFGETLKYISFWHLFIERALGIET